MNRYLSFGWLGLSAALEGSEVGDLDVLDGDEGERHRLELENNRLADAEDLKNGPNFRATIRIRSYKQNSSVRM